MKRLMLLFLPLLFIWSCAGDPKMLPMRDTSLDPAGAEKGMKTVEFPKGTWTGTASTEQAGTLAQVFVNSHNMAMREFDQVKDNQEKMKGSLQNLEGVRSETGGVQPEDPDLSPKKSGHGREELDAH